MMRFWEPVAVLLAVRYKVAHHAFTANPGAFLATILLGGVVMLAAFFQGMGLAGGWSHLTLPHAEAALRGLWLQMQLLWLLALLIPGGLTVLGPLLPPVVRRPFAIRASQSLVAELVACLVDIPLLPALLLTLPLALSLLWGRAWMQALITLLVFALLALQTGVLAHLLNYAGTLGGRTLRRWAEIPLLTAFMLVCLCAAMPPALASLTTAPSQSDAHKPRVQKPHRAAPDITALLPPALAAHAVVAARGADYFGMSEALGGMVVWLGMSGWGTWAAFRRATESAFVGNPRSGGRPLARKSAGIGATRTGLLSQLGALLVTEARLLFRTPQNYLPLRKPAGLLLLGAFAFLAPDMSKVDPVYNLKEFLGISAILYSVLWQMQLLCNRLGNEADTGAMLFSLSVPRRCLLLGKNLALFLMLWALDSIEVVGLSYVGEATRLIPLFMLWLPMILLTLTALGNLVSVVQPFAIAPREKQAGVEPPDALASLYIGLGFAVALLLAPVPTLLAHGVFGGVAVMAYLSGLYGASLMVSGRLLTRNEPRILAKLEGKSL